MMPGTQQDASACEVSLSEMSRAAPLGEDQRYFTMLMLLLCGRVRDEFLENFEINIAELPDVQAAFAGLVFARLWHQLRMAGRGIQAVHTDIAFARREPHKAHIALAAALILVVITAEADDA